MCHCWEAEGCKEPCTCYIDQTRRELDTLKAFQWAPPPAPHLGYLGGNYTLQLTQCNHTHHSGCFLMPSHLQVQNTEKIRVEMVHLASVRGSVIFAPIIFHLSLYLPATSGCERRWGEQGSPKQSSHSVGGIKKGRARMCSG